MKIVSYNVNGIRAALNKGFLEWLHHVSPDVICLQEIKANKEQFDLDQFEECGYKYHYWYSAEKKGYSGVAILSKAKPDHVEFGTGIEYMDREGRNLRADFDGVSVMSLLQSGKLVIEQGLSFHSKGSIVLISTQFSLELPSGSEPPQGLC